MGVKSPSLQTHQSIEKSTFAFEEEEEKEKEKGKGEGKGNGKGEGRASDLQNSSDRRFRRLRGATVTDLRGVRTPELERQASLRFDRRDSYTVEGLPTSNTQVTDDFVV
jgi:hypothetical protein